MHPIHFLVIFRSLTKSFPFLSVILFTHTNIFACALKKKLSREAKTEIDGMVPTIMNPLPPLSHNNNNIANNNIINNIINNINLPPRSLLDRGEAEAEAPLQTAPLRSKLGKD